MKPIPTDPMAQYARFMAAFCDDLIAGDYTAPRAKAVCEISRQQRDGGSANNLPPSDK